MTTCAIVPVRSLADGKRRLAGVLDDAERAALNERFLVHALDLAATLPGPTFVVSLDPRGRVPPGRWGRHPCGRSGSGSQTPRSGRDATERVLKAPSGSLSSPSICRWRGRKTCGPLPGPKARSPSPPDRRRQGTNGLCLAAGLEFAFRFGVGSFAAHVAEAERLGVEAAVIENSRLALDIDTPEDWRDWRRSA